MNTNEATKGAGIVAVAVISKGSRKAQVIVTLEGGAKETRHLEIQKGGQWTDRLGNVYEIS